LIAEIVTPRLRWPQRASLRKRSAALRRPFELASCRKIERGPTASNGSLAHAVTGALPAHALHSHELDTETPKSPHFCLLRA